jgi:predicted metal-dependent enzyme (double-stranded beta helix superfamily)
LIRQHRSAVILLNNTFSRGGKGDDLVTTSFSEPALEWLRPLADLPPEIAIREATPLLAALIRRTMLLDHLPRIEGGVAPRNIQLNDTSERINLQLFLWPAGVWTPIHDHTSWGVYACVAGSLLEDRYVRIDDGAQPERAHLRRDWRAIWRPGQQSQLLPYAGGIHRIANPNLGPAVSLHLYGPRVGAVDGRDYDPRTDSVCDRPLESTRRLRARLAA